MQRFTSNPVAVWVFLLLCCTVNRSESAYDRLQKRSDDLGSVEAVMAEQAQELSALKAELQAAKNDIATSQHTITTLQNSQGSTFIRWGRSTCPSNSVLLYSGTVGGSHFNHPGSGVNRLCLTKEPVFDNTALEGVYGQIEGIEYYIPGHINTDALCAVCRTSYSDTFMVPGTNRCPSGAVMQYQGHLTSGNKNEASTEFLCLDASPEDRPGSHNHEDSGYFDQVRSHCGALPCPPYVDNKVVTCAVCSV